MKKIEIFSSVENFKLKRNRNRLSQAIKSFNGKDISITIKVKRKNRSNSQNAYYWGVIIPIWIDLLFNQWGEFYSMKETHEFLKFNCNYNEKVNKETGEILRVSKSTTDNTTTDQEVFHEKTRRLAFEMFECEIPLPNEQIQIKV